MEDSIVNTGNQVFVTGGGLTTAIRAVFHGLEENTTAELRHSGEIKTYEASDIIIRQGTIGDTFYILMKGRVAITKDVEGGEQLMIGVINQGKYFGEMSLLDDSPRTATCTALTDVSVLEMTKDKFTNLIKTSPALAYEVIYQILSNLRRDDEKALASLVSKTQLLEKANTELKEAQVEIVKSERFKRELEIAGEVQRSLLPKTFPKFDDYDFGAYLGAIKASGDFYDVIELDDEHIGVLFGDVADQGVHASMFMAVARTLFRVESKRSLSPIEVTRAVHKGMLDVSTSNDMFIMAFYGVLHRPTGMFSYVVAGQERPFLNRPSQGVAQLQGRGSYLGLSQTIQLEEKRIKINKDDRLILFSDGVISLMNSKSEPFGKDRLIEVIRKDKSDTAAGLVESILNSVNRWGRVDAVATITPEDVALLVMSAK